MIGGLLVVAGILASVGLSGMVAILAAGPAENLPNHRKNGGRT